MLLEDHFYSVVSPLDEGYKGYSIALNGTHTIYMSHFPGHPITPGVCLVQICVELISEYLSLPLTLRSVKNVKFLAPVSPLENHEVDVIINKIAYVDDGIQAQCTISNAKTQFAKLSFVCVRSKKA